MSDHQLIGLLEKYLQGNCSEEEKEALELWYEDYRAKKTGHAGTSQPDLHQLYNDITDRLKAEGEWEEPAARIVKFKWKKLAVAAVLAVLISAAGLQYYFSHKVQQLAISTREGERKKITLEDGTEVWMNVGSRLSYPGNIADGKREVVLEGEAFFDVAKHESKPFTIRASDMRVRVLGTRFNVKAYKDDEALEAALIEGSIAIDHQSNSLTLKAGEKLTLKKKDQPITVPPGARVIEWPDRVAIIEQLNPQTNKTTNSELEWMDDKLSFKDKSFPELARLMSRWYKRKIILRDTFPEDYRFKGTFKKETVTEVLKALQITADFHYTIKGDTIYLHH
jgi:ferric-dicitrate binding protein FerR (iron transport regulator)